MITPTAAFSATVKLKGTPAAIAWFVVSDASCVPVPLGPENTRNANVSPMELFGGVAGALNESVQLRTPLVVTQSVDVELTSKFVSLPPLMLSSTDDAFGETNCG